MNLYANGFRFSIKDSGEELILQFHQTSPIITDDGEAKEVSSDVVASLVMHPKLGHALATSLLERLPPNP